MSVEADVPALTPEDVDGVHRSSLFINLKQLWHDRELVDVERRPPPLLQAHPAGEVGRDDVPAFIAGPARTYGFGKSILVEANEAPAAWMAMDGQPQLVLCGGRIHAFSRVLTPDQLGRIRPASRHRGH